VRGSDLRCPKCDEGAADVAPDYEMPEGGLWGVSWTCTLGHKWISGMRPQMPGGPERFENLESKRS
jgi:hypothetical protein